MYAHAIEGQEILGLLWPVAHPDRCGSPAYMILHAGYTRTDEGQ